MNDPKEPKELLEELKKKHKAAHAVWLENPTTQLFLQWLKKREGHYTVTLQEHILQRSDKEFEDKHRSAITTCKAIHAVASNPENFVAETFNNKNA